MLSVTGSWCRMAALVLPMRGPSTSRTFAGRSLTPMESASTATMSVSAMPPPNLFLHPQQDRVAALMELIEEADHMCDLLELKGDIVAEINDTIADIELVRNPAHEEHWRIHGYRDRLVELRDMAIATSILLDVEFVRVGKAADNLEAARAPALPYGFA